MRLYYAPGTISIAVVIALHEADLPFEAIAVDFRSAAQTKPEYLAINPKGRVPALEADSGQVLTETGAVLDYIAAIAPDAGLVPRDAGDAAHMRGVMYYLASTMHVNHAHKMRGSRWASAPESHADMAATVPRTMADSAAHIEQHALRGDYVMGEDFSLADPYLFVVSTWLRGDDVDIASYPKFAAFQRRMISRASVQAAIEGGMIRV
ncbi:glutathione S-transferase family protein [Sulfitobacter sabulilitoris]|uniref:Glutathione S-transferase family protein n=1 Tax=Sulfitobacter sabulilitoris TaxID=2562655 RepID=A0A5S3PE63_9RHOB|nr:glutathione S-transferase family protein [Sulfitobacter sabulilitoris]TMM52325.1 glutathione S-transferase family protein [Sulfitobacter sabulilitoris]